ncbi:MAG: nucleoside monophosphate kinase [Nanoarchaeota archaeon]
MIIVMFGPPGIGKGTASAILGKELNIPKISTGDILREEMQKNSPLGDQVKSIVDSGNLVPDNIIIKIFEQKANDFKNGYITDGFPRTVEQAKALDKIAKIDFVFNLQASHDSLMKRLTGRRYCNSCGSQFNVNIAAFKPKKADTCSKCGGKLAARTDQEPKVVEQRLKVYEKETKPVISYYKKQNKLHDIDAEGLPEKIVSSIISIIRGS